MANNKGGGGHFEEEVIEFTPNGGFDIRTVARKFSELMLETLQPLIIHLPAVSIEFEPGCTAKEIVDGYHYAIKSKVIKTPSNANTQGASK